MRQAQGGEIVLTNRLTLAQDTGNTLPTWHLDNSSGRFRIFSQPNIDTVGSEWMTIDSAGSVGIGTKSPQAQLHATRAIVAGPFVVRGWDLEGEIMASGASAGISFARRTLVGVTWPLLAASGDLFTWYNADGNARLSEIANGNLLVITPNGRLGLGIDPSGSYGGQDVKLDVAGYAAADGVWLKKAGPLGTGAWAISYIGSVSVGAGETNAKCGRGETIMLLESLENISACGVVNQNTSSVYAQCSQAVKTIQNGLGSSVPSSATFSCFK